MPTRNKKQEKQKGYKQSKVASRAPSPAKRKRAAKTPSPSKRKVARNTPSPAKGNRKAPPEDLQHLLTEESMPTLRRVELTTTQYVRRSARNRTPAPSPPKVLTLPGERHRDASVDPFHPLDYTNHGSPGDLRMLAQAAAATVAIGDDLGDFSVSSSESAEFDSGSKDQSYKPRGDLDNDDLFYSDNDDLDAYFDHRVSTWQH